jgi:hypothetical protein
LQWDLEVVAESETDALGQYQITISSPGTYDLCATLGTEGDLREEICLCERTHQTINLTLKPAIIIEGTLLMLDDKTPHVAVIVQAVLPLNLTPPAPFLRKYR